MKLTLLGTGCPSIDYKRFGSSNLISSKKTKIRNLKKRGIILIKTRLNKKNRFDLKYIFKKLFSLGIKSLLVEGGDEITKNMLNYRLIDQFYLFKSRKILLKSKKHVIFSSDKILKKNYKLKSKILSIKLVSPNSTEVELDFDKETGFILDRTIFDYDLSEIASDSGAEIYTESYVKNLIIEDGFVKGVEVERLGEVEKIYSKIV